MLKVDNGAHIKAFVGYIFFRDADARDTIQPRKESAYGDGNGIKHSAFTASVIADKNSQIGIQLGMEILEAPEILNGNLIDLHGIQPFPIS
jgi:hypothetical protein